MNSEKSDSRLRVVQAQTTRTELQQGLEARQLTINQILWDTLSLKPSPGTILDICTGTFGSSIAAGNSGYSFVGIDLSIAMLKHHARGDSVTQADAAALPFPTQTFDGVTMVMAMNNVFGNLLVAKEISRVLKVEGRLGITDAGPNIADLKKILFGLEHDQELKLLLNEAVTASFSNFFSHQLKIDKRSYCRDKLKLMYGLTEENLYDLLELVRLQVDTTCKERQIISPRRKAQAIISELQIQMNRRYFDFVEMCLTQSGLKQVKKSVTITYQEKDSGEWIVLEPQAVDPNYSLGSVFTMASDGFIEGVPSSRKLRQPIIKILPIAIFQKTESS